MKNIHIKPNRGLHFCISRCNLLCNLVLSLYIRGFVPKVTRLHWLHLFFTKNIFFYFLSYISNRNRQQQYLLLFFLRLFIILFMTAKAIAPPFQQMMTPLQQMQQGFQNTMQQIQNDPFPLIEQFLGQRAMSQVDQATEPMQQEAIQKVSGVMSGIRSLVNEAFPNMGGGMSTTGQLGQGIASLGGTAIPAAPFTTPAEIPSTPMQPPMMGDPSPISTTNYVPKVGLGGDPDAPKTNLPPAQMLSLFNQQMGGSPVDNVFTTSLTPIGETNFDDLSPEKQSEMLASLQQAQQNFNSLEPKPMVEGSGMGNPMALKNPLINLAYNFNMENSPF